jgi:hypothetical protein
MASPTVSILFVVPRDGRSLEVGTVRVSIKVVDHVRSVERLRIAQAKVKATKVARTVKFIKELKDEAKCVGRPSGRTTGLICKAVTLAGTPCKSKANCGAYCKRHFFVSE